MAEETKNTTTSTAAKWAERLRGRSRMAVAAIGGVFLVGFVGVSRPLGQRIDAANERLTKAEARAQLAGEVASLRRQSALYTNKLRRGVDGNDWTNYILDGIRNERVRLIRMDPKDTVTLGPCKALVWQVDIEGDFRSLSNVVAWLENGERLIRIDRLVLQSANGKLVMSMVIKGLALDTPVTTDKTKPAAGGGGAKGPAKAEPVGLKKKQ
jgi:hypothetical protein